MISDYWKVIISGGENYLGIDKGEYTGDCEEAISKIKEFCLINTISIKSRGRGYGTLKINDIEHNINPYGIDISMMLEWCNIDMKNIIQVDKSKFTL